MNISHTNPTGLILDLETRKRLYLTLTKHARFLELDAVFYVAYCHLCDGALTHETNVRSMPPVSPS